MANYSVLTDNEKEEAAGEGMLRAAARKGFNQGVVVGALIAAATSVICTVIEHYISLNEDEDDKRDYERIVGDEWDDTIF